MDDARNSFVLSNMPSDVLILILVRAPASRLPTFWSHSSSMKAYHAE